MLKKSDTDEMDPFAALNSDPDDNIAGEKGGAPLMHFTLRWVDLDLIDSAPIQPEGRDEKISLLLSTIQVSGWIAPPILMRKGKNQNLPRYEALDGHRRIAVAKALGETRLQCLIGSALPPAQRTAMFIQANSVTRPFIGNERITGYCQLTTRASKDAALSSLPTKQATQIRELERIFGERRLSEIAAAGKAIATVPHCARAVQSWCRSFGLESPTDRQIGEWIIKFKMSRTIDTASRKIVRRTAEAIVNCIQADRKYERTM